MGTSIHPHVEIKVAGRWEHYSRPYDRNNQQYDLFGKMAGVRDKSVTPICAPKGIPADASFVTRFDYEHQGSVYTNNASWFNRDEIAQLSEWYSAHRSHRARTQYLEDIFGYLFGNALTSDDLPHLIEDVRLVFWFDD